MNTSGLTRPIFKVARNVNAFEQILEKAVSEINPLYFDTNSRFKNIGKVSLPVIIDYMGIYEEGDWWALTIIKVMDSNNLSKFLFLPLTSSYVSSVEVDSGTLPFSMGDAVFELETYSQTEENLRVKIFDAFTDIDFYRKLINLFLPWKNIPEAHANAYTVIHESGVGKFTFHFLEDTQLEWDYKKGILVELTEMGDMSLKYGNSYQLIIYKVLPFANVISALEKPTNFLGYITYSGVQQSELLLGTLSEIRS